MDLGHGARGASSYTPGILTKDLKWGGGGRRQVDGDIHFVMFPMTYLNGVKTATDLHIQFFSPLL